MNRHRRPVSVVVTVAATLAVVASCSQTTAGTPDGSASPAPTSAAAGGVSQPLDPNTYLGKPCDLVSQSALTQLGYTAPGTPNLTSQTAITGGPSCDWYMTGSSK